MAIALTDDHVSLFHEQGYLVLEGVLDDDDLAPLWGEYSELLDGLARRLQADGVISDCYADLPCELSCPRVLAEYPQRYKFLNSPLPLINAESDPSDKKPRGTVNGS